MVSANYEYQPVALYKKNGFFICLISAVSIHGLNKKILLILLFDEN